MPIQRCLQGGQLAIAIVEVVLIEQVVELKEGPPYLEDPSRSTAMEQLVIRLPQQLNHWKSLLACPRSRYFHQY